MTNNYFQQGNQLLRENKLDQAIAAYQAAIKQNSNFYGYYQNLGDIFAKQGKLDEAIANYRCAVEINPNSAWSYNVLGEVLSQKGAEQEALFAYKQACKINPNICVFQENLNEALAQVEEQTKVNRAEISTTEILNIETEKYQSYLDLGDELQRQGKIEKAIINYLKVIRAKPEKYEVYYRVLDAILYSNDFSSEYLSEINRVCQYAIEERKNNDKIFYFLLGRSLTKQGEIEKAKKCFQSYIHHQLSREKPEFVNNHWDSAKLRGPQFLVIGATKCGTTTLFNYINQHPQILRPIYKEIRYFATELFKQKSDYYFAHFPPTPGNDSFITGESDPGYLYMQNGTQKVFGLLPKIKLIIILRNPVDRAISHYHHWVRMGKETRSLELVMESELEKIKEVPEFTRQVYDQVFNQLGECYLGRGLYYFFVKQWLNIFPREQILILKTEDFNRDPTDIMNQVFGFLGVPKYSIDYQKRYNMGSYDPVSPDLHHKLSQFFKSYNQRLEEYLGMKFDWN